MKKFLSFLFLGLSLLFLARFALAQESNASQSASTAHLSFPITQLGNCSSVATCKTYCDDPTHVDACIAYAKEKGFYHATSLDSQKDAVLADAESTLGCNSVDACRVFCQQSQNADACSAFAQKHNLLGGKKTQNSTTLEKAKTVLGCDSATSCQAFCQQEENKAKCSSFAKTNGLNGGNQTIGPGGCTTDSTCKVFCSNPDNFQACARFVEGKSGTSSAHHTFSGPGGCTTESSCKAYCLANPAKCHLPTHASTQPNRISASGSAFPNTTSTGRPPLSPQEYCRLYADHCISPTQHPMQSPTPSPEEMHPSSGPVPSTSTTENHLFPPPTRPILTISPVPSTSVKGASTKRDFLGWLLDSLFHFH